MHVHGFCFLFFWGVAFVPGDTSCNTSVATCSSSRIIISIIIIDMSTRSSISLASFPLPLLVVVSITGRQQRADAQCLPPFEASRFVSLPAN